MRYADANCDCSSLTYRYANSDSYWDGNCNSDIHTYCNIHGNRYCYSYDHTQCYAYSYSYAYSPANAHCQAERNTKDTANAAASPITLIYEKETHYSIHRP